MLDHQCLIQLNKFRLFHNIQLRFTKCRSTIHAGVELLMKIYEAFKSQDALGLFYDLSKVFDCVHRGTLI